MQATFSSKLPSRSFSQVTQGRNYGRVGLWVAQGLLTAVFLFAGSFKLILPAAMLTQMTPLPPDFIRFIGVCEVLGALGMVLPGVARTMRGLTVLAACGLIVIMTGAVTLTIAWQGLAPATVPFVVGSLAIVVAYGRREWLQNGFTLPAVLRRAG